MGTVRAFPGDDRVQRAVSAATGVVQRCAELHSINEDRALARIGELCRGLTDEQTAEVLANLAAHFMVGDCWYRRAALDLLIGARADLETAEEIAKLRAARQPLRIGDAEL